MKICSNYLTQTQACQVQQHCSTQLYTVSNSITTVWCIKIYNVPIFRPLQEYHHLNTAIEQYLTVNVQISENYLISLDKR